MRALWIKEPEGRVTLLFPQKRGGLGQSMQVSFCSEDQTWVFITFAHLFIHYLRLARSGPYSGPGTGLSVKIHTACAFASPSACPPLLPATAKQQNPSLGSVGSLVLLLVKTDEGSYSKNINPRYPGVFSHTSQIIPLFTSYFRGLVPVSLPLLSQLKVLQG